MFRVLLIFIEFEGNQVLSFICLRIRTIMPVAAMRIEAKRQQSKFTHKRGIRHPLGLMEPIVGALV